ncbi:MAG: amidohydrolase [Acidimicrobiales bacterium]|nr:amidohydrolase [Acidimicrobiales bacterium]
MADRVVTVANDVIIDGAVDIDEQGLIADVGPETALGPPPPDRRVIGGVLMPGLVNTHAHTPMTLVRSVGDGLPLQQWLTDAVWPREGVMNPDDARVGMMLGSAEMLLAGVTTSCEMYLFEEQVVEAVAHTGGRLVMTPGIIAALHGDSFGTGGGRADAVAEFARRHHDPAGLVTVGVGPHSTYDLTPAQIGDLAALAGDLGTFVHVHLEETSVEHQRVIDQHGKPATELLADHGVFDVPVLAAHGVWLSDSDRAILSAAGAAIAHNPVSNLKLGSGIMDLRATLDAGIRVGLGTDGPASNDNLSLWQELALAPMLARAKHHDAGAVDAATALELATSSGAAALGLPVGRLEPGAPADIVRLDSDHPTLAPGLDEELITTIVFSGGPHVVTDVWVQGRHVVDDRTLTTVDLEPLVADAKIRAQRLADDS